ncbi:MAG: hypothetical protein ACQETL_19260 [Bacteroidota bacterium]
MEKKVFLTYNQTEILWFTKIVSVPYSQLNYTQRTKACKFVVELDEDNIIQNNGNNAVILFSSVDQIEVPKSEFNLFRNQFKVPPGLLSLSKTKTPKDQEEPELDLPLEDKRLFEFYTCLRRSLTQLIVYGYRKNNPEIKTELSRFIESLSDLTPFVKKLIIAVHDQSDFPQKPVKGEASEDCFKFIWWGKFCIETILDPDKARISEDIYKEHKAWFRKINWKNVLANEEAFTKIPELFRPHYSVMYGYFLAALSDSAIDKKNLHVDLYQDDIIQSCEKSIQKLQVLFWVIFFRAFLAEGLDFLYPNPLIRDDFYKVECFSLILAKRLLQLSDVEANFKFNFNTHDENELLRNYEKLINNNVIKNVTVLSESEIFKPFSEHSQLFGDKRNEIVVINKTIPGTAGVFYFDKNFEIKLPVNKLGITTYYGDVSAEDKERLKSSGFHIKIKDLSSLLNRDVKVLLAFLADFDVKTTTPGLLDVYRDIVKGGKRKKILEEFIVVWIVNEKLSVLQSPEFTFRKEQLKNRLESELGLQTTIIAKSIANDLDDNVEIIRNLRISLKHYKAKNIEIVDVDFDKKYAIWVLEAINDYIVKYDNKNYYTLNP